MVVMILGMKVVTGGKIIIPGGMVVVTDGINNVTGGMIVVTDGMVVVAYGIVLVTNGMVVVTCGISAGLAIQMTFSGKFVPKIKSTTRKLCHTVYLSLSTHAQVSYG